MGMFDYVQVNTRLPVKKESFARRHLNPFQSKSVRLWERPAFTERAYNDGCLTLTIAEDGRLLDPDGAVLNWSGDLIFYGHDKRYRDFVAECRNGQVSGITFAA